MKLNTFLNMIAEDVSDPTQSAAFRRWFGQSKAVDDHGNPMVVYHGTNAHAYVPGRIEQFYTNTERGAAFFSSSKRLAHQYGERLYEVFLRIENPLIVYGDGRGWASLDNTLKIGGKVTDELRTHHDKSARSLADVINDLSKMDGDDYVYEPVSRLGKDDTLDKHRLDIIPNLEGTVDTDTVVRAAKRHGYDGVIFHNIGDSPVKDPGIYKNETSNIYAVFSSSQIKAVSNNGEWDTQSSNIYETRSAYLYHGTMPLKSLMMMH